MPFNHTILQIVPRLDSGGAERSTLEMTRALAAAGARAIVVSSGGRLVDDIRSAGGEFVAMPVHAKDPLSIYRNAGRLANLINEKQIDLVHARSRAPAWSALIAARRTSAAFVTTYHGAYRGGDPLKKWLNSSMIRADRVIANSRYTGNVIASAFKTGADKLRIIPRGADLDWFDPKKITEARRRARTEAWGISPIDHEIRVLMPARLTRWKGHDLAIDALTIARRQDTSGVAGRLRLVFCGGAQSGRAEYLDQLRAQVKRCGVSDMAHFVGDFADMPAAYDWADIVISPSLRPEAFGRVPVEAGAMGVASIVADHGGAGETVVDGETGMKVKPGNVEEFAAVMMRLANAPDERTRLGANASKFVASHYTTAKMCADTISVYTELLE